jgi:hypothetical protein
MSEPKWVCVCGSRSITNRAAVKAKIAALTYWLDPIIIVTGACPKGPDRFAEEWAESNRIVIKRFHAEWDTHGRAAGPIRNEEMAMEVAARNGYLLAFRDGVSSGTADMIDAFRKAGGKETHLRIVRV